MSEREDFLRALRLLPAETLVCVPTAKVQAMFPAADWETIAQLSGSSVWVDHEHRGICFRKPQAKEVARG